MRVSIRNFPLTIDPSVDMLEAQTRVVSGEGTQLANNTPGTWKGLFRVPTQLVYDLGETPPEARHFFGDHRALAHCRFLVCYSASGALTGLMVIGDDGRITVEDLPDEFMGLATELPSVRLVFRDPTERERFIDELSPRTLEALAEPPRRVGVSVVSNGNER
jgi:hypothetical protein